MVKRFYVFWFLCVILIITHSQDCKPFGVRLSLGKIYANSVEKQILQVLFNTNGNCPNSYMQISDMDSKIQRINCNLKELIIVNNSQTFKTYIYKCSLTNVQFNKKFQYMVYGKANGSAIPFRDKLIQTSIFNPNKKQQTVRFIILGDWGFLRLKTQYTPLDDSFDKIISSGLKIDGIINGGDVGYDLDTNNCQNYVDYLVMTSQVAIYWPIIYTTGNHQYNTPNNYKLFTQSFQLYELDAKLAIGLNLGPFYLTFFDPYDELYLTNLRKQRKALKQFTNVLKQSKKFNKYIISTAHYPLACSGDSKNCKNDYITLKDYYNLMIDNKIGFYIGCHWHTYERIYPFYKNGTFKKIQSPYRPVLGNYLLSVVEGIAGNDKSIVQSYTKIQNFTAALSYNQTGFAIMTVNQKQVHYEHFSAKPSMHSTDQFIIQIEDQNQTIISQE